MYISVIDDDNDLLDLDLVQWFDCICIFVINDDDDLLFLEQPMY